VLRCKGPNDSGLPATLHLTDTYDTDRMVTITAIDTTPWERDDLASTVKDVARLAGVSTTTVSRVLNNHPQVSAETRLKVQQAIAQCGYRPSQVARGLRLQASNILGLIISDIANPFFPSVVRGIEDVAYAHQYRLLLCNSGEDAEREALYIDVLQAQRVAGVIISPHDEDSTRCETLIASGIPVVAMDRRLRRLEVDTVVTDNIEGAYQAVRHLLRLGHRRVGLVGGPLLTTTGRERQEGYRKALLEAGIQPDQRLIKIGDFRQEGGYRAGSELLAAEEPPTAIFVSNNLMALGVLDAIREKGLKIPEDIALVAFDDLPWAASLVCPLTTVAQPTYELGQMVAEMLLGRIADRERPIRKIKLEPTLIVRQSCGSKAG
jgi:LacI family transcriptional regulator